MNCFWLFCVDLWIYKDYVQAYPPVDASYKNDNLHDGLPYAIAIIGALLNHTVILFSLLLMVCSKPIAAKLLLFGGACRSSSDAFFFRFRLHFSFSLATARWFLRARDLLHLSFGVGEIFVLVQFNGVLVRAKGVSCSFPPCTYICALTGV